MLSTFIALPVGQGDAFFYRDDDWSVLVDGGRSKVAIAPQLQQRTGCLQLDVLVCTHNDADHANGVLGVLESSIQCGEVWLPGRWTERLKDLLTSPNTFHGELLDELVSRGVQPNEIPTLDELGDRVSSSTPKPQGEDEVTEHGDDEVFEWIEAASEHNESFWPWRHPFWAMRRLKAISVIADCPGRWGLLMDALDAASRIREIAIAAYHSGAKVKWFEFKTPDTSVNNLCLTPVNCVEIFQITQRRRSALDYLALSKSNRESLVFSRYPSGDLPGVVFSADSDFTFPSGGSTFPDGDYIVTAPHHGSEANASAYERWCAQLKSGKLIRSDGRFRSRPGNSFMSWSADRRYCTLCRGSESPKKKLEFLGTTNGWQPVTGLHSCECRDDRARSRTKARRKNA